MHTVKRLSLAITATACLFACSGPTEPDNQSIVYPLAMGNQWEYNYTEIWTYSDETPPDTARFTVTAKVVASQSIVPGVVAYTIYEHATNQYDESVEGFKAYINRPEGMYAFYRSEPGPTLVLPKRSLRVRTIDERLASVLSPMPFPAMATDFGIKYYDPAPLILPYPQRDRFRWTLFDSESNGGLGVDMQIDGWESVNVPTGTFNCVAIDRILVPPISTVEYRNYIGPVGLVARTVNAYDVGVGTYEFPWGDKTADISTTLELTSYTLNRPNQQ